MFSYKLNTRLPRQPPFQLNMALPLGSSQWGVNISDVHNFLDMSPFPYHPAWTWQEAM